MSRRKIITALAIAAVGIGAVIGTSILSNALLHPDISYLAHHGPAYMVSSQNANNSLGGNWTLTAWSVTIGDSSLELPNGSYAHDSQLTTYSEVDFNNTATGSNLTVELLNFSSNNEPARFLQKYWSWGPAGNGSIMHSGNSTYLFSSFNYSLGESEDQLMASFSHYVIIISEYGAHYSLGEIQGLLGSQLAILRL